VINYQTVVLAACGVSAGVHVALGPSHLEESRALGVAFLLGALLVTCVAAAIAFRPAAHWPAAAAAASFAALLVSYVLFRDEDPDALAVITKVAEATGFVFALRLLRLPLGPLEPGVAGTVFALFVAFGLMLAGGAHG
jgi:hypothetical protein